MKRQLHDLLKEVVNEQLGVNLSDFPTVVLSHPPSLEMGDYASNVALVLSKHLKKNPGELAQEIAKSEKWKVESLEKVEVAGGFLNFTLSQQYLRESLSSIADQQKGKTFGSYNQGAGKKVIVEYFQNNVAKPPHVGHLRSAVIGDSLKRIFQFLGYEVISDTHVGDWGVQFGVVLYAFKTMGDRGVVERDPIQELNKLYVTMSAKIEQQPELRDLCKQEFVKLEQGDVENRELWQWFVRVSMDDFERYRQLLDLLPFEFNLGESFFEDKMPAVLKELEEKGLVKIGETGEKYVDLEEDGLGRCILVKSDGGTTYHLRDFATYKYRKEEIGYWKNVYAVDVRQSHHFKQLFKVLEKAGYPAGQDSVHVDFGFISLPEGAISTRKGNVISLESLITEATTRARAIIEEKNPALIDKDKVARIVGLSALKYFDLMHNRQSNITFTWDSALSFEGNTGPYLQYTFARINGIGRKSFEAQGKLGVQEIDDIDNYEFSAQESSVLRKLLLFPEFVEIAATEYYSHIICNYLFELAQVFNRFYEASPVNQEKDPKIRYYRQRICISTAQVIKNGLGLLGIETVEEM